MVKKAAGLVRCAVKVGWKYEVKNFLVHAAKVGKDFEFRMWDFGFFDICFVRFKCGLSAAIINPKSKFRNGEAFLNTKNKNTREKSEIKKSNFAPSLTTQPCL